MSLLEKGFPIKEYTQVYEDITYRVPVQFVGKDFYKYFPFSRNNKNKFYLAYRRLLDIILSVIGLTIGVLFLPLNLIGNALGNRGKLFYGNKSCPIIGRVSMDLVTVDISGLSEIPEYLNVFSPEYQVEDFAKDCQTISHEVLVNFGERVSRIYSE